MNIMTMLSKMYSRKYHNLIRKAVYFRHELLKNRPKHS